MLYTLVLYSRFSRLSLGNARLNNSLPNAQLSITRSEASPACWDRFQSLAQNVAGVGEFALDVKIGALQHEARSRNRTKYAPIASFVCIVNLDLPKSIKSIAAPR
jgi:hypothetical protein